MSERKLSLPEFAALVALSMEKTEINNSDLQERHGLKIDGDKRRNLNELKLVDSWKQGRAYVHVLTESGAARLEEDLRSGQLPAMTGSPGIVARGFGNWLQMYMDRSGLRLADVSTPLETAPPESLEARIRAAYAELSDRPGAWVRLARLRPLLGDVPRDEVDTTLIEMDRLEDVTFIPESNQKAFTPADREAGVTIGGQEKHLLWIGEA